MQITLFEYKDAEDIYVQGNFIGVVRLEDGTTSIEVENQEIKERMETFFSRPLTYYSGDRSGMTHTTLERVAQPHTEEFFSVAPYELQKMSLKALLQR